MDDPQRRSCCVRWNKARWLARRGVTARPRRCAPRSCWPALMPSQRRVRRTVAGPAATVSKWWWHLFQARLEGRAHLDRPGTERIVLRAQQTVLRCQVTDYFLTKQQVIDPRNRARAREPPSAAQALAAAVKLAHQVDVATTILSCSRATERYRRPRAHQTRGLRSRR